MKFDPVALQIEGYMKYFQKGSVIMWVQDVFGGYVNLDKCDRIEMTEAEHGNISLWEIVTGDDKHTYTLWRSLSYRNDDENTLANRRDELEEAQEYLEKLIAKVNGHGI